MPPINRTQSRTSGNRRHSRPGGRRGSIYLSVLAVASIVSLMCVNAMWIARLQLHGATASHERYHARTLAMSAIEHAMAEINTNTNWQTDYAWNTEYPTTAPTFTNGSFTWRFVDQGGGARRLDGIGRSGEAECILSVDLGSASPLLNYGLLVGGDISVGPENYINQLSVTESGLCTNGRLINFYGTINSDVEAQSVTNTSGTINGTVTAPAATQVLPTNAVFDYYVANASTITPPEVLGELTISKKLMSPEVNPYGAANADGIYIVDGYDAKDGVNRPVSIQECRIVGTLIVRNASVLTLDKTICWEPARNNFPALLVQGDCELRVVDGVLQESATFTNFNPTSTPYQGASNATLTDQYPSIIAGIVYCTGNLIIDGKGKSHQPTIQGVVIAGGNCYVKKTVNVSIEYDNIFAANPPPGFGARDITSIVPGSWRQTPTN